MHKKIIYRLLTVSLFVLIAVTFLIPSDLFAEAETRKFWVKDGHYEDQNYWVTSGYFKDTQEKRWVDTSHMVYQGYYKNVSYKEWKDTSYWVYGGHYEDVTERVWVTSGYTAYRDVKKWTDTSHWVYVKSGYWKSQWINTSHWETRYRNVRQSYRVYVSSGYWQWYWKHYWYGWRLLKRWINTSHWETRYRNVRQSYRVYVSSGYWNKQWVDTSHMTWIKSGYWSTVREPYYVNTSHWENQKVWVAGGHWETRYRNVENWQPANLTIYVGCGSYGWGVYSFAAGKPTKVKIEYKGAIYRAYKRVIDYRPARGGQVYAIRYDCYEVLSGYEKEAYSVWVAGGHWKRKWVDTSHWVNSGYWQYYTYKSWVDTSYMKSEGHWQYYTSKSWEDTSHWETRQVWVDTSHWVEVNLDPDGKVLHTEQWNINRINYNTLKSGDPDEPRGYEIFFNGEKFILEADTLGDFNPGSVSVEFLGTKFSTELTNTEGRKWEGYIWDESFINFHDRPCVFKFTASYDIGIEIEDEVTVYIVRDFYWLLRRGF